MDSTSALLTLCTAAPYNDAKEVLSNVTTLAKNQITNVISEGQSFKKVGAIVSQISQDQVLPILKNVTSNANVSTVILSEGWKNSADQFLQKVSLNLQDLPKYFPIYIQNLITAH